VVPTGKTLQPFAGDSKDPTMMTPKANPEVTFSVQPTAKKNWCRAK
jgi:hypothetical protein